MDDDDDFLAELEAMVNGSDDDLDDDTEVSLLLSYPIRCLLPACCLALSPPVPLARSQLHVTLPLRTKYAPWVLLVTVHL